MPERSEDVVAEYKSPDGERITHIRSTLITSSLQTLKALGFFERYLRALPKAHHDQMLAPRAPGWVDVAEAAIHYNACQNMALSVEELERLSESVVTSVANTLLSTFNRASRAAAGGSPWLSLVQAEKLFPRLNRGGTVRVSRRGANEALVEVRGGSLYAIPYYEIGHCAMLRVSVMLFAAKVQVRTVSVTALEHRAAVYWS
jgi:hypothetical protein